MLILAGSRFAPAAPDFGYRATLACWGRSGALRQASSCTDCKRQPAEADKPSEHELTATSDPFPQGDGEMAANGLGSLVRRVSDASRRWLGFCHRPWRRCLVFPACPAPPQRVEHSHRFRGVAMKNHRHDRRALPKFLHGLKLFAAPRRLPAARLCRAKPGPRTDLLLGPIHRFALAASELCHAAAAGRSAVTMAAPSCSRYCRM
jgi:hypothetical protein